MAKWYSVVWIDSSGHPLASICCPAFRLSCVKPRPACGRRVCICPSSCFQCFWAVQLRVGSPGRAFALRLSFRGPTHLSSAAPASWHVLTSASRCSRLLHPSQLLSFPVLVRMSPKTNDVKGLFLCLVAIGISYLEKHLFRSFAHFEFVSSFVVEW